MIIIKSHSELDKLRVSNKLVAQFLLEIEKYIVPGFNIMNLENLATDFARSNGAWPGFKGYQDYPFSICTSLNNMVVHGFPHDCILVEGDILSVDFGILKNGYNGDAARTFAVGSINEKVEKLLKVTKECLDLGISKAVDGNRIGDIGAIIFEHAQRNGLKVVKEFVGHGIGRNLHEDPKIPNYGFPNKGTLLKENMVIAIEPILIQGEYALTSDNTGWGVKTKAGSLAAHFENTIIIKKGKAEIISEV